jgi:hypothetical protein
VAIIPGKFSQDLAKSGNKKEIEKKIFNHTSISLATQ